MSDLGELSMRWLAGWSAATGHSWTTTDSVIRIEAMMASRRFEYLLVEPSRTELDAVSSLIGGDSRDVVTVFTEQPDDYLISHRSLVVDRDDEALMTTPLAVGGAELPATYELDWDDEGPCSRLQVVHQGELAAAGGVAITGEDAIFDRIETMPRFRRQGLGRAVMRTLTARARDQGAGTGILAASYEGQQLYRSLGWTHECAMLMFRGTPERVAEPDSQSTT